MTTRTLDRRGDTRAQVAPFFDAYMGVYRELQAAGQYPYNACFEGRIPGIEGPSEETFIYYLQTERSLREIDEQEARYLAEGWERIDPAAVTGTGTTKYRAIVHARYYCGGTGWQEWATARLSRTGSNTMVLPKGHRTHGVMVWATVLVLR